MPASTATTPSTQSRQPATGGRRPSGGRAGNRNSHSHEGGHARNAAASVCDPKRLHTLQGSRGTPSKRNLDDNGNSNDDIVEVFDPEFKCIYDVPSSCVVHLPPARLNITRLVLCRNYRAHEPWSCGMGHNCKFVHADCDYASLEAHPIHVNYIWRDESCCTYPRLADVPVPTAAAPDAFDAAHGSSSPLRECMPGVTARMEVLQPNGRQPAVLVPVDRVLPTKGVKAFHAWLSHHRETCCACARGPPAAKGGDALDPYLDPETGLIYCSTCAPPPVLSHCAHYYFNRMCNRGERCNFIHAVYVDPTVQGDFKRAPARWRRSANTATGAGAGTLTGTTGHCAGGVLPFPIAPTSAARMGDLVAGEGGGRSPHPRGGAAAALRTRARTPGHASADCALVVVSTGGGPGEEGRGHALPVELPPGPREGSPGAAEPRAHTSGGGGRPRRGASVPGGSSGSSECGPGPAMGDAALIYSLPRVLEVDAPSRVHPVAQGGVHARAQPPHSGAPDEGEDGDHECGVSCASAQLSLVGAARLGGSEGVLCAVGGEGAGGEDSLSASVNVGPLAAGVAPVSSHGLGGPVHAYPYLYAGGVLQPASMGGGNAKCCAQANISGYGYSNNHTISTSAAYTPSSVSSCGQPSGSHWGRCAGCRGARDGGSGGTASASSFHYSHHRPHHLHSVCGYGGGHHAGDSGPPLTVVPLASEEEGSTAVPAQGPAALHREGATFLAYDEGAPLPSASANLGYHSVGATAVAHTPLQQQRYHGFASPGSGNTSSGHSGTSHQASVVSTSSTNRTYRHDPYSFAVHIE